MQVEDARRAAADRLLVQGHLDDLGLPADDTEIAELAGAYGLIGEQVANLYSTKAGELLA